MNLNRAMLLKPSFEAPNDSTEQILKRGITPINSNGRQLRKLNNQLVTKVQGGFWEDYLRSSINEWEKLAGETGITFRSGQEQEELIRKNVRGDGTHASLENTEAIAHLSLTDPLYKVGNREKSLFGGEYFQTLQPPVFHISKEQIRAYYHGWVLGKGSVWKDEIGTHILECAQVVLEVKKKSQAYVFIYLVWA